MGMFLNYQNIADNYTPNNLINAFPLKYKDSKLYPIDASKPFEEYNVKGELEGYFWRYGDTLNLEFNLDGEITLEGDAIVVTTPGVFPTVYTVGKVGQRFYNLFEMVSYSCISTLGGKYYWEKDEVFTYPTSAERTVYISAEDYLKDKNVEVVLYNFRMEPVHSEVFAGSPTVILTITKKLSESMVRGIYYCSVKVFSEKVSQTVFEPSDCKLLVK